VFLRIRHAAATRPLRTLHTYTYWGAIVGGGGAVQGVYGISPFVEAGLVWMPDESARFKIFRAGFTRAAPSKTPV
jgi:hypothetical protein